MSRDKFKVYQDVFDEYTLHTLYKLASKGYFDVLVGPISTGKEANVYSALLGKEYVALKIYVITTSEFKTMWRYLKGDPRFTFVKMRKRSIIPAWTRKEYSNLKRMHRCGVRVPKPIAFLNNVLVMEFIGEKGIAAPIAKKQPPKNPKAWFKKIIKYIALMYKKEDLIHGDISEYNIMNYNEEPVVIDVSQAVLKEHPLAEELLKKDIKNIIKWFEKQGIKAKFNEIYKKIKS